MPARLAKNILPMGPCPLLIAKAFDKGLPNIASSIPHTPLHTTVECALTGISVSRERLVKDRAVSAPLRCAPGALVSIISFETTAHAAAQIC